MKRKIIFLIAIIFLFIAVTAIIYRYSQDKGEEKILETEENSLFDNSDPFAKFLTEEDFEITKITWNEFNYQYVFEPGKPGYKFATNVPVDPIDWDYYCKNCGKVSGVDCNLSAYIIYSSQTKDLHCIIYYNGHQKSDYPEDMRWLFSKDSSITAIGLEPLDIRLTNEIKVCCISEEGSNELCKTAYLSPKC